jgi:hypothetical protein
MNPARTERNAVRGENGETPDAGIESMARRLAEFIDVFGTTVILDEWTPQERRARIVRIHADVELRQATGGTNSTQLLAELSDGGEPFLVPLCELAEARRERRLDEIGEKLPAIIIENVTEIDRRTLISIAFDAGTLRLIAVRRNETGEPVGPDAIPLITLRKISDASSLVSAAERALAPWTRRAAAAMEDGIVAILPCAEWNDGSAHQTIARTAVANAISSAAGPIPKDARRLAEQGGKGLLLVRDGNRAALFLHHGILLAGNVDAIVVCDAPS